MNSYLNQILTKRLCLHIVSFLYKYVKVCFEESATARQRTLMQYLQKCAIESESKQQILILSAKWKWRRSEQSMVVTIMSKGDGGSDKSESSDLCTQNAHGHKNPLPPYLISY